MDSKSSRQLLFSLTRKDFIMQVFRCGGKGGQKQNKTSSGVRIIHPASGAVGESRTERYQHMNKTYAFKRLIASIKFQQWLRMRFSEIENHITLKAKVEQDMIPSNLKVEVVDESGDWVETTL